MGYSLHIIDGSQFVVCRLFGKVGVADTVALLDAQFEQRGTMRDTRVLCDIRNAQPTIAFRDMCGIMNAVYKHDVEYTGMRWAMITGEGLLKYALARQAGEMVKGMALEYTVFKEIEPGANWLAMPACHYESICEVSEAPA